MGFFGELKRRNVVRVGIAYVLMGWVLLQAADFALDLIDAPNWVIQSLVVIVVLGLPVALFFAWAFELTPEGIKRDHEVERDDSITPQTGKRLDRAIIVFLVLVILGMGVERFFGPESTEPESDTALTHSPSAVNELPVADGTAEAGKSSTPSIAVLPFRDMSAAQDQAYFGEGIAEELLNGLVKLEGIEVASRTSSFALAEQGLAMPDLAARLNVGNVLEGSVRTAGNNVRVTAQLIDVSSDKHLWSETFDGTLDDIFAIQDEITGQILEQLEVQLSGQSVASIADTLTSNPEAYRLYLQARALWRQRTTTGLYQAVELFRQAVALDPEFHQAWGNMAVALVNIREYDVNSDEATQNRLGAEAADQALAINGASTEALAVKGDLATLSCEFVEVYRLYQAAIDSAPNEPTPYHWMANRLLQLGLLNDARKHIDKARDLDPLIAPVAASSAILYLAENRFDEALIDARTGAELGLPQGSNLVATLRFLKGESSGLRQEEGIGILLHPQLIDELVAAYRDKTQLAALESKAMAMNAERTDTARTVADTLILGTSARLSEFLNRQQCPELPLLTWSVNYREQRGSEEFFRAMEHAGVVDFWREYGWPDDCASLNQELAECPE